MNVAGWAGRYVGENLASGSSSTMKASDADDSAKLQAYIDQGVSGWSSEKNDYALSTNTCASGKVCGHYTQLIWAETTSVGCAIAICSPHHDYNAIGYNLACAFGPGGNIGGQRPY